MEKYGGLTRLYLTFVKVCIPLSAILFLSVMLRLPVWYSTPSCCIGDTLLYKVHLKLNKIQQEKACIACIISTGYNSQKW